MRIGLNKLINGRKGALEVHWHHNLGFLFFDLEDTDFSMSNFAVNCFDSNRVYFFIFWGNEHTCNTSGMNILNFDCFIQIFVIKIHKMHSVKKGLILAVVTAHYFHHPINHLGSQIGWYLLLLQTESIIIKFIKGEQMVKNIGFIRKIWLHSFLYFSFIFYI